MKTLKAYVETTTRGNLKISLYLISLGFTVKAAKDKKSLIFEGGSPHVIAALTNLRYKFPIAYKHGFTCPDEYRINSRNV